MKELGIEDWGLGIGNWEESYPLPSLQPLLPSLQPPVPSPQSPVPIFKAVENHCLIILKLLQTVC